MEKQDIRSVLDALPEDEIVRLTAKKEDYLLTAVVEELERRRRFPVVELRGPESGRRTVANLFADRARLGRAISNVLEVEEKARALAGPEWVENAPVYARCDTGDKVNEEELPLSRHYREDAGRYITSGIVVARDPDTGRYNLSFHRMQLKDRDTFGISLHSRGDLWRYWNRSRELGKDLEIAVVIGVHPAYYLTAGTRIAPDFDDYDYAAAYLDEKVKLTRCRTVDLAVPAHAEYVLEGVIRAEEFGDEGPFGEYTGYGTSRSTRNIFHVTAIARREDPIYLELVPGFSMEHLLLSQYTREIILLDQARRSFPGVRKLNLPKNGCHFHAYVSIKDPQPGEARQLAMLLFGLDRYLKLVVVVDEDIDVFDEEAVLWACATRMQADRDVYIVPGVICNALDPSSKDGVAAKMCIDATRPAGFDGRRITLPEESRRRAAELLGDI